MTTKIITVEATPPAESTGADYYKGAPLNAAEFDQNLVNLRAAVDRKASLSNPTFTGTVVLPATTSIGDVSATELQYLNSVTSNVQDQINSKAPINNPTFTGTVSLPGGTANGVLYLNGSKVATSGSALTFDGTNLGVGVTPSAWSVGRAIEIGVVGNSLLGADARSLYLNQNAYYNGGWKYANTYAASQYMQRDGAHSWLTAPSGTAGNAITFTQAMTLDASGVLTLANTDAPAVKIDSSGTKGGVIVFKVSGVDKSYIGSSYHLLSGGSSNDLCIRSNNKLQFSINGNESMTLNSSGYLQVGTTSTAGEGMFKAQQGTNYFNFGPNNGIAFVVYNSSNTGVYLVSTGTSWSSNSDERLKDIIEPIANAAEKVSSLRAVIGKYKTDEEGTRRSFLIAQDVQAVLPEAVNSQNDEQGTLGLQYTDVIPLLVAAIKELKMTNDSQAQTIESLTQRIEALEYKGE